jgi:hypothetical protein
VDRGADVARFGVVKVTSADSVTVSIGVLILLPSHGIESLLQAWYAPPADLAGAVSGATDVYGLEIPNVSYNVLSFACPRTIRDAWVDSPSATPADTSCLARMPPLELGQ